MSTSSLSGNEAPNPEALFAEWAAQVESGKQPDFEELVRCHSAIADRLRRLHDDWKLFAPILGKIVPGLVASDSKIAFASCVAGEPPEVEAVSLELLVKLGIHAPNEGRYRFREVIGRGGGGVVLKVWDTKLNRPLAMKVVLGRGEDRPSGHTPEVDGRRLARFVDEARIASQLNHPGIVPVHDLGADDVGRAFFTMKLVKGEDLAAILGKTRSGTDRWNQTRALNVLLRACEAVAYAHDKGVIHRDLKPANVMAGSYGEVYVMDWGLARVLGEKQERDVPVQTAPDVAGTVDSVRTSVRSAEPDSPLATKEGDAVGTPIYMSPEQAKGRLDEVGPRSDVYSLGAMLYELLSGERPYCMGGSEPSPSDVLDMLSKGPPRALASIKTDIPAELIAICEKAMERNPPRRYASMGEMAADLEAYLEGRAVHAHRTGVLIEARKWVRRNRALAASMLAGMVVLVSGLLATSWQYVRAEEKSDEAAQLEHARLELTRRMRHYADYEALNRLEADADRLWPLGATLMPVWDAWIRGAEELVARRAEHEEALESLREKALPWSEADKSADLENHPDRALLTELERKEATYVTVIKALEDGVPTTDEAIERELRLDPGRKEEILSLLRENLLKVQSRIQPLRGSVAQRVTWRYHDPDDERWDIFLQGLLDKLDVLADPRRGCLDGTTAEHGVGVRWRLEVTGSITRDSIESEAARARWLEAIHAIADPDSPYRGLRIEAQWGLLPIGADPRSGLWEFAHLQSGEAASRGAEGDLVIGDETGVVLVLLPGGRVILGAQDSNPDGPNFEPGLLGPESPPYEIEIAPFFLSKFELTQAQWLRACGSDPSNYGYGTHPGPYGSRGERITGTHPVEHVSWDECSRVLGWMDLTLPAEAQWEYAVRGGSSTIFWTGDEVTSMAGAANIADRTAHLETNFSSWPYQDLVEDGWLLHAPVDQCRPNPFGLHGMLGNVSEWCKDPYGPYSSPAHPGTGERSDVTTAERVVRDSNYESGSDWARSSYRNKQLKDSRSNEIGVRPARLLVP